MNKSQAKAILASLHPEVLRERQRIVDTAVRAARDSGHCDTFNTMLARVLPEFTVNLGSYTVAMDSEGRGCSTRGDTVWAYYGVTSEGETFDERGFSRTTGLDRDGFDQFGYDADGFDAQDRGRAYQRVQRRTRWINTDGTEDMATEQVYVTGYGRHSGRDADGNQRLARAATPEELADEADNSTPWNPTTWVPPVLTLDEPALVEV